MHGTTRARTANPVATKTGVNAVVWIGRDRAIVLREGDGDVAESIVPLPELAATTPIALAEIAHRIGHVDRVLVLGSDNMRTALEREIVAIGHAPDTIREAPVEGTVDREGLLAQLHRLA